MISESENQSRKGIGVSPKYAESARAMSCCARTDGPCARAYSIKLVNTCDVGIALVFFFLVFLSAGRSGTSPKSGDNAG